MRHRFMKRSIFWRIRRCSEVTMRMASRRTWVRAGVASFSALLTFALVFWFAFAHPWVADSISKRIGYRVELGQIYPAYRNGGVVLVLRDLVVSGRAPFDREPLAYCDRIEVTPGKPLRVDVSGLDLRLLATRNVDNVRGIRVSAKKPLSTSSLAGSKTDGLSLYVHSGSIAGVIQLPGGDRVAMRAAGLRAERLSTAVKGELTGVALDLGKHLTVHAGHLEAEATPAGELIVQGNDVGLGFVGATDLINGVAIEASASDRGWTLSANTPMRPGMVSVQTSLGTEGIGLQINIQQAALRGLSPLFDRFGVSVAHATGSLNLQAHAGIGESDLSWQLEGATSGIEVHNPAVDSVPWQALFASGHAKGTFEWREGQLAIEDAQLAPMGLPIQVTGSTTLWGERRGSWSIKNTASGWDCENLHRKFAPSIQKALWGMELSGHIKLGAELTFDAANWDKLGLNIRVPSMCAVKKEPKVLAQSLAALLSAKNQVEDRPSLPVSTLSNQFTSIDKMPPHLLAAFMTAEDSGFFQHQGFEPENIRRALVYDLERGRFARGASTITQQVAKNLFLSHERTVARKLTESVLTWRIDSLLPKRRVLELYLNLVELGPDIRGVGAASQAYFGKTPAQLTPLEAVHLASLPPNPRGFARRFREGSVDDGWLARLYDLVGIMGRRGQLTADQVGAARSARLRLRKI